MTSPEPFIIKPDFEQLKAHNTLLQQIKALEISYEQQEQKLELPDNEKKELINDTRLQAIGSQLWEALKLGDELEQAKEYAGRFTLPIIIESADSAVLNLPWEILYHPTYQFLARVKGFSLTRRHNQVKTLLPQTTAEPLRILLFTSLPDDLSEQGRLDTEAEQAIIQSTLAEAEQAGRIILEMPDDGRFESFQAALNNFSPHIVYLSGHGQFTHNLHQQAAWGEFLFEDEWGNGLKIKEQTLLDAFQAATSVQAVIFSACQSAKSHPNYNHSGLTQALYKGGIPHVIGMRESVYDKAATNFAETFFAELTHETQPKPIEQALQSARTAIIQPFSGKVKYTSDPQRESASYGQWCLPQQYSQNLEHALIDWNFTPQERKLKAYNDTLDQVSIPTRFIGRRRELRQWQNALRRHETNQLMIIGAGGMGKTALAGKLLRSLEKDGYEVFALSLRKEDDWQRSVEIMANKLKKKSRRKKYQKALKAATYKKKKKSHLEIDESKRAHALLTLLIEQYNGKLALLLDNLETAQNLHSTQHELTNPTLQIWLDTARKLESKGLKLILTSRWQLPDWADKQLYHLGQPIYTDYLTFARQLNLPLAFLKDSQKMQNAYETLGGNFRALEFFAKAIIPMNTQQEQDFIKQLQQAQVDIQTNMAIEAVYQQCDPAAQDLLQRMRAYQYPVDLDGVRTLALQTSLPPLKKAEDIIERLLSVSLLEQYAHPDFGFEIQLSPLVRDWLNQQETIPPLTLELQQKSAQYLLSLLENKQKTTWQHILNTQQALEDAQLSEESEILVLKVIVGIQDNAGRYQENITHWLPKVLESKDKERKAQAVGFMGTQYHSIADYQTALEYLKQSLAIRQEIGDKSGEGATLNNISAIYNARGDYQTALEYLKQSLAIQQEIGDTAGLCITLFNMGHIHIQNEEVMEAVSAWVTVYKLAKPMELAQILEALTNLAPQLGLPEGLEGWEQLSQQMDEAE